MKLRERITIILFCSFLLSVTLCYLFLPKADFSENEKRYLEEMPALSWESVASGDWGNDIETYLADHIPGRDFFVGVNAYFNLFTGRQAGEDIWLKEGKLIEAPVSGDSSAIARNVGAVNKFADTIGQEVDFMVIPSAGWAMGLTDYHDDAIINGIIAQAEEPVRPVDVTDVFAGRPELYYDTDHHWTSEGAYEGYKAYMESQGKAYREESTFEKTIFAKFQGSTYSRSALWLTAAEELELWQGSDLLTVTNGESDETHEGVFYWERLEEADKYTVFLDGNHSIVRVRNPEGTGKLLVIRDSYSNSLGCFLAESYEEVVLIDLRYYRQQVSQLVSEEAFDDILVCYSIGNFLTDTNLVWLR